MEREDDAYIQGMVDGENNVIQMIEKNHNPYVGMDDSLWCACGWTYGVSINWIDHIKEVYGIKDDSI